MWQRLFVVAIGVSLSACAASPSARPNAFSSAGRNVITAAEIVASRVTDVYQAVSQLRPEFLRRRAISPVISPTPPSVIVYVDEVEFGHAETLRMIPLDQVRMIRYVGRAEAELRYGKPHPAGAIMVTTLQRR